MNFENKLQKTALAAREQIFYVGNGFLFYVVKG
jgi:hypothetical protein